MHIGRPLSEPTHNWAQATRGILLSTVAATLSWWVATSLFGDHPPVFAAIAAIVCLSPGVASHGRQAVGMLVGVGIGIAAGELATTLPTDPVLRIAFVTPVAMLAAASFGLNAVMIIQAGASAIIVVAGGQTGAGFQRVADAAVGGCVGLLFSQVLFTPDPVAIVERAGAKLAGAQTRSDPAAIRAAAAALDDAIMAAQAMVWWTVRGRLRATKIAATVERWRGYLAQLGPTPTPALHEESGIDR